MSNLVTTVLNQFMTDADNNRALAQSERMDIYLDCYKDQIIKLLKTQFQPENYQYMLPMVATYDNVLKKIINLKAQNYKEVPQRSWVFGEDQEEDEQYQEVISNSNLDSESISLEKFAFVNNIAFMRAKIVKGDDKITYEAVAPENISIEQDEKDPMRFHALSHAIVKNNTSGEFVSAYHVWTDGLSSIDTEEFPQGFFQVTRTDANGNEQENEKVANPYIDPNTGRGIIPYVEMRTVRGVDFWNETINSDLSNGTIQINVQQTHLNNLMKWSGYRQTFLLGDVDTKQLQKQKGDVGALIQVKGTAGQPTPSVQTEEMAKDPNELLTAISREKSILADNHGVSFNADAMGSGQRQTAEAMTINRQQIIEIRKSVLPLFREYEHKLAWYTVIMANTPINLQGLGKSIDVTGEFSIDYQEPKVVTDPKSEFELDLLMVNAGIMNKADLMIKYNPDIKSEDQAIDRLKKNQEINAGLTADRVETVDQEIEQATTGVNVTLPQSEGQEGS